SRHAEEVFLLLFDTPDGEPTDIIKMTECTKYIWHCFVHGIGKGQLYGYRIRGPYDPSNGYRFNYNKLLLDPYAKAITHKPRIKSDAFLGYDPFSPEKDLSFSTLDSGTVMPKCIVIDDNEFDWGNDSHPDIPFEKLIIYETHVKGFTAHPSSKVRYPGTYLGFIEKIPHLLELGVNAVELLPVHEFWIEDFLKEAGLTNYWGYNSICFFAPESTYAANKKLGAQVNEFKTLVKELHKAGIEVILDVVYNHTGEGNELGPTLSFRGIDNSVYYLLDEYKEVKTLSQDELQGRTGTPTGYDAGSPDSKDSGTDRGDRTALGGKAETKAKTTYYPKRKYRNYSGCGNTLNFSETAVIKMIMDSLRYWVEVMHVDGFRFDLASIVARKDGAFQKSSSFFDVIAQDPVLNRVKLIAEPWDIAGYEAGKFPVDWAEWNDKYRDCIRRFIRGDKGMVPDLGYRLTGSADLYGTNGRSAYHSINYITSHDGFTMMDLVSYSRKHNESNLENNKDGQSENYSVNCGVEGPTSDLRIVSFRKRLVKNFITTLLCSAGTPMILGGDEFCRTQHGNNNAYCQDNEISWYDWSFLEKHKEVFNYFKNIINFRKNHSIFMRRKFFLGQDLNGNGYPDIRWYNNDLGQPDWNNYNLRTISFLIDGAEEPSPLGEYLLFIILNSDIYLQRVHLPPLSGGMRWYRVIDTSLPENVAFLPEGKEIVINPAVYYLANPFSIVVLKGKHEGLMKTITSDK
ncbi:MAG: alpha-amylase family glycosyl hydrolase, partial [Thermoplasmata archaeon]